MKPQFHCRFLIATLFCLLSRSAFAADVYYRIPLDKLKLSGEVHQRAIDSTGRLVEAMIPYVRLDVAGEAYCAEAASEQARIAGNAPRELFVRAAAGVEVTGKLYFPAASYDRLEQFSFVISKDTATVPAREFELGKAGYYDFLVARQLPGSAWFRYQAVKARGVNVGQSAEVTTAARSADSNDSTFGLFTGGRALSENLQLNRALVARPSASERLIDIDNIKGITIREIDWKPLIKDKHPQLDPLADFIPSDQHAIFFPTFAAFVTMADEADRAGTPIVQLLEPRSEDAGAKARYQRQMCLSMTGLGRFLGKQMVNSVAVTGSDPYLRVGSDLAICFEAKDSAALRKMLAMQIAMASQINPAAKAVSGKIAGVEYSGAVSGDRTISSYQITLGDAVIVSNSLAQLERLVAVNQKRETALASLPEYTFFRDRYKRGEEGESALIVLSDATIRRWCGPKWRIADSRRTRAAAIMSDFQAQHMDSLVKNTVTPGRIATQRTDLGELSIMPGGVSSSIFGSLDFMTPINELDLSKVSTGEAETYQRWRDTYQQNWSQYFDPIAIRLCVSDKKLAADMTVMPLIAGSQYNLFIELSRGVKLSDGVTDQHDSLAHFALAINKESQPIKALNSFAQQMTRETNVDLLGWIGQSVSIYADDDPYWKEMANSPDPEKYAQDHTGGLPVALSIEATDPTRLAAFMSAARTYIATSSPGLSSWTTIKHKSRTYTKIEMTQAGKEQNGLKDDRAIFYAMLPDQLVLSFNENVIKRAIDRYPDRAAAKAAGKSPEPLAKPFVGQSMALQVQGNFAGAMTQVFSSQTRSQFQLRAWANIPILNEYKRLYPDQDPIKLHEKLWGVKLLCPGRGSYVWNEKWQTMESTVYGHPGEPKSGPAIPPGLKDYSFGNFGVDFENNGLRARGELERNTN